jgi:hypothetical protein
MRIALIGEAGRFRSANLKILRICHIRRALPVCGVRIVAPIILAQHKRN